MAQVRFFVVHSGHLEVPAITSGGAARFAGVAALRARHADFLPSRYRQSAGASPRANVM